MNNLRLVSRLASASVFFVSFCAYADDCEFIRTALQAFPQQEVVVPAGTYTCDHPIILDHDQMKLRGEGTVLLKLADKANAPLIIMGDAQTPPAQVHGLQVQNIQIDGNRKNQQMECWGGPCDSGTSTYVRNNGISVRNAVDSTITNVKIKSARSGGVVSERNTLRLTINGLDSSDNEFDGYAACETTDSDLSNMNLHDNQAAGISTDMNFNRNKIHDSQLIHNGDVGIFMRSSSNNTYQNLTIADSGNHGVFMAWVESSATCTMNNDFENLNVSGSKGFGFLLFDTCSGNKLGGQLSFQKNRDGCIKNLGSAPLMQPDQITCVPDLRLTKIKKIHPIKSSGPP